MRILLHLAGNIAPLIAGLVTAPLTARALGPQARGELAILMISSVFIGLVGAFGLGLLARQDVAKDLGQAHGWSRRGRRLLIYSSAVAAVLGVGLTSYLRLDPAEGIATVIFLSLAGMSASKSIDANILIVAGHTKQFGAANLTASLFLCVGIVAAFLGNVLQLSVVVGLNAGSLLLQMFLIVVPRRRLLRNTPESPFDAERVRVLVRRAWRAWRSQVLEAGLVRADSLIFITQATVQTVGYYSVVALIPQTAYQIYLTLIQTSYARSPKMKLRDRTWLSWQVSLCISVPLVASATVAAVLLIPILFGEAFRPALELLVPAASVTVGLAGMAPVLQHFAVSPTGDAWFPIVLMAIAVACAVVGLFTSAAIAVSFLGVAFTVVGAFYTFLLVGGKLFRFSPSSWRELYGRAC
ncbi:oligosaccharide flippase family protein [Arthrobacter sp. M4]|uniref:oligosaccharide flippase family protein n=1 Tax=Arthrobacter sp. M4 TaxID=218160 RepID=UPI001CDD8BF6|nr:oligosaccharide flippase family protein [Arthrobacter sp. M4]MCA4133062.1 oligosaccharide flippase family protein [Arthrobacter sp. M4]